MMEVDNENDDMDNEDIQIQSENDKMGNKRNVNIHLDNIVSKAFDPSTLDYHLFPRGQGLFSEKTIQKTISHRSCSK